MPYLGVAEPLPGFVELLPLGSVVLLLLPLRLPF
jgi:hypothetical protein